MIPTILFIGAMLALSAMWLVWLAHEAPEGWQDADGFHLGRKSSPTLSGDASGQATGRVDTPQRVDPATLSDRED